MSPVLRIHSFVYGVQYCLLLSQSGRGKPFPPSPRASPNPTPTPQLPRTAALYIHLTTPCPAEKPPPAERRSPPLPPYAFRPPPYRLIFILPLHTVVASVRDAQLSDMLGSRLRAGGTGRGGAALIRHTALPAPAALLVAEVNEHLDHPPRTPSVSSPPPPEWFPPTEAPECVDGILVSLCALCSSLMKDLCYYSCSCSASSLASLAIGW